MMRLVVCLSFLILSCKPWKDDNLPECAIGQAAGCLHLCSLVALQHVPGGWARGVGGKSEHGPWKLVLPRPPPPLPPALVSGCTAAQGSAPSLPLERENPAGPDLRASMPTAPYLSPSSASCGFSHIALLWNI